MIQQSVKAERFLNAINKAALEKCKDINRQVEEMMEKELAEAQTRIETKNHKKIDKETAKIKINAKLEIANCHSEQKNAIYKKRLAYEDEIFRCAKAKILEFCDSEQYKDFLMRSANEILEVCGDKCDVYLNKKDFEIYAPEIKNMFSNCTVNADDSIELGGIKVRDNDRGILYDNSIDSKFEEQKVWFYDNAPLHIEID